MDLIDVQAREVPSSPTAIHLAIAAHPLCGSMDLRTVAPGASLAQTLASQGVQGPGWAVSIGGLAVPCAMWPHVRVKPGQLIEARSVVRKQVLQIAAVLVLSYFTLGAGGMAAGGLFATGGAVGGGFLAAGAFYLAGTLIINKLLGPKTTNASESAAAAVNPTYSLAGGRNRARQFEPLSLLLGETKIVPDLAAQQFTEFRGEDQYLSTMFHAGVNCGSISDIKIGSTAITAYEGVTVAQAGFPGRGDDAMPSTSVDAVAGGLLDNLNITAPGPYVTRTTSVDTVQIALDLEATLYDTNDKGEPQSLGVNVEIDYRPVGAGGWMAWPGGAPLVLSNGNTKPLRQTLLLSVARGQYEVRLRKTSPNVTSARQANTVSWSALKSYQPDTADYGGQPRVRIEIKASGQLSGALDEINWLGCAAPMLYWNGAQWVTATAPGAQGISNPGAQILQLFRGIYRADGKRIAGMGLSENRIDLDSLKGFMERCAAMDFRFDAVIQENMSMGDLLDQIADTGFGRITRQSGKYGVWWMAEDQPIEGVINMAAMKARSFAVEYTLSPSADELQYEFFDRDNAWTWQPVRVKAPGVGTPQNTASTAVLGTTRAAQAARRARLTMAQSIYSRKSISFDLDLEHLVYRAGAVLSISHDLTQWGHGGRLRAVTTSAGSFAVVVDEPVPTNNPGTRSLGLRIPGERQMRVFAVAGVSADGCTMTINGNWPAGLAVPTAQAAMDVLWMYDFKAVPGYRVRVASVQPKGKMAGATVTVVPESGEFWNYVIHGAWVAPPNNSLLLLQLPVVTSLRLTADRVRVGDAWRTELTATFDTLGNYAYAQVWAAADGNPLELLVQTPGARASWFADRGQNWTIEVRPFDPLGRQGAKAVGSYTIAANLPANVAGLSLAITPAGVVASWATPVGIDAVGWAMTELRTGATWETAAVIWAGKGSTVNLGWQPAGEFRVWAAHKNTSSEWSSTPASAAITIAAPLQPLVTAEVWRNEVALAWQDCTATQPLRTYLARVGAAFADSVEFTQVNGLGAIRTEEVQGNYVYWVTAVDMAGNASASGYVSVTVLPGIDVAIDTLNAGLGSVVGGMQSGINLLLLKDAFDASVGGVNLSTEAYKRGTAISEIQVIVAEGDEQLAQQITLLTASVGENYAAIQSEATARANADEAEATARTTLASTVSRNSTEQTAAIQTEATTRANQTGALFAKYGVTLFAGGKVSGFQINNDSVAGSDFVILSDRFAIAMESAGTTKYPFTVGMIDGVASIGINANMYVDGTIKTRMLDAESVTADKIKVTNLAAVSAVMGSLHSGSIRGGAYQGYAWPAAGGGYYLGPEGLLLGNAATGKYFQATADGNLYAPGFFIENGAATFSGALSGASGSFSGSLTANAINAVNTINIAGNAVTIPVSAASDTDVAVGGETTLLTTPWIDATHGSVVVMMSVDYTPGEYRTVDGDSPTTTRIHPVFYIYRNGLHLKTVRPTSGTATALLMDVPSGGATYTLTATGYGISHVAVVVHQRTMVALGVRR